MALGDFRGDYDALAAMLQRSFGENKEQPLLYTGPFLQSLFRSPGAGFALAPALYQGEELIAFVAGFPFTARIENRPARLLLSALLAVAVAHKRSGYGPLLWGELAKRARAAGHDGMLSFCVDGDAMNRMILGLARLLKLPTEQVFSVRYAARLLRPAPSATPPREDRSAHLEVFLRAARMIPARTPLARTWTPEEAAWQCQDRLGAVTTWHAAGTRAGILTGCIVEAAGNPPMPCLLLDDLLWGDLEQEERQALLREFLDQGAARGARMAIAPLLGYADVEPLTAAGFRRIRRILHVYLTTWNEVRGQPGPLESLYVDLL